MFIGHQYLVRNFQELAKHGKLAHSYVFFGEPQVGKFSFALSLANFLETKEFDIPEKLLSEILIIKQSGIDCVREIKNFLWQKPNNSLKRIVVIDNADSLTAEAQNAILKITEEPPEHALIILIANNTDNLLPPILSRLHKVYFGRVTEKEIAEFIAKSTGISMPEAVKTAENAYGRPGMALDMINNKELKNIALEAEKFLKSSGYARSQIIKNLIDEQKEKPAILDRFFEILIIILRKDLTKNYQLIRSILSRLFLIKSYNVNKRLQIEAI
jgi:DNA polymerase-3 subunit delta'